MSSYIAVSGAGVSAAGVAPPPSITGTPYASAKAGGASVYAGSVGAVCSAGAVYGGAFTATAPSVFSFTPSAKYVSFGGKPALLQQDSGTFTLGCINTASVATVFTCTATITNAGQVFVKAQ